MKTFIVIFAVMMFAVLMGLVTFSMMGPKEVEEGSVDQLLEVNRMEDASEMVLRLTVSITVAAIIGSLMIIFVLPKMAMAFANLAYDQSPQEYVPQTRLDTARSLKMQGEFEQAIEEYRISLEEEGPNPMVWFDIAQIQLEEYEQVEESLKTLRDGWESHEWEMDDDTSFMTKIAEFEMEHFNNRDAAVEIYKEMLDKYDENEYNSNRARSALLDMGVVV